MQVKDIMTTDVITVTADISVEQIAALMLERHISGVPVVDSAQHLLGIVSEGDLINRSDSETSHPRSWWLRFVSNSRQLAADYVKTHGLNANDVMTQDVISVSEEQTLGEVAQLLEKHRIKRVPVLRDNKLVGLVSRANLLQGLAAHKDKLSAAPSVDDRTLRADVMAVLKDQDWLTHALPNVIVNEGVVELWGWVDSDEERRALLLAVEGVAGVKNVISHLAQMRPYLTGV